MVEPAFSHQSSPFCLGIALLQRCLLYLHPYPQRGRLAKDLQARYRFESYCRVKLIQSVSRNRIGHIETPDEKSIAGLRPELTLNISPVRLLKNLRPYSFFSYYVSRFFLFYGRIRVSSPPPVLSHPGQYMAGKDMTARNLGMLSAFNIVPDMALATANCFSLRPASPGQIQRQQ